MRLPNLNQSEIEMIVNALYYVYGKKLDSIRENRKIITESEKSVIIEKANEYTNLADKINNKK
jgi:hypothetical protein